MKFKLFIFALFFPCVAFPQLSDKVNALYADLNQAENLEGSNIGYGGQSSEVYAKFDSISKIANDAELLYMVENGNLVTQGYLSALMVERKSPHLIKIFSKFVTDNQLLHIQSGCMGYDSTIAANLYEIVHFQYDQIVQKAAFDALSPENRQMYIDAYLETGDRIPYQDLKWTTRELDSLMNIFDDIAFSSDNIQPETLNHILRKNNFNATDRKRIKYFAGKYPTREILATLAHYQNRLDLPLLHAHIKNAFLAISKFPHASFLADLEKSYEKQYDNLDFIEAVAAFCNSDSEKLLQKIYGKIISSEPKGIFQDEQLGYLHEIVTKKNCPLYKDILLKTR